MGPQQAYFSEASNGNGLGGLAARGISINYEALRAGTSGFVLKKGPPEQLLPQFHGSLLECRDGIHRRARRPDDR
jgi:hypothetical protein